MKKKRILVVDDEITTTRLLKLNLEKTGVYEVLEENQGTNALNSARAFQPDFMILDVCMPGITGGELAARFATDPHLKCVPLVFLTSMVSQEEAGGESLLSGNYHFLPKPVSLRSLVLHIEKAVTVQAGPSEAVPQDSQAPGTTSS